MIKKEWKNPNLKLSFLNALRGLIFIIKLERYSKIIVFSGILVIILGIFLKISVLELVALITVIALVFISETLNAILENTFNLIKPNYDLKIKTLKEMSAGFVLFSSMIASIVGSLIFIPKLIKILKSIYFF
ncbi:MAG: diacylglycerol kinase family protein [Candidatus Aenigmatarchaeota archaeon]